MLILLTAFHTLHNFLLNSTDFQNFPGPVAFFQDFPVLENARIEFQDFPGFPGPVRTLNERSVFRHGSQVIWKIFSVLKINPRRKNYISGYI